jgi:hypothetical protein
VEHVDVGTAGADIKKILHRSECPEIKHRC